MTMLLIYKEKGLSSFAVVQRVRKITGVRKVGHAGTLDPMAEGLLIVLVGKDETKTAQKFSGLDKEYEAVARLGVSTDTGDLEGEVVSEKDCSSLSDNTIKSALLSLKGEHRWEVPKFSAIKVKGRALYKYARANEEVDLPKKNMHIYKIELISITRTQTHIDIKYRAEVSSGTYIRTISEKLGKLLSCPATTTYILRTKIGKYDLQDAQKLDNLEKHE